MNVAQRLLPHEIKAVSARLVEARAQLVVALRPLKSGDAIVSYPPKKRGNRSAVLIGHLEWRENRSSWGWSVIEHETGRELFWGGRYAETAVHEFRRCWRAGLPVWRAPSISDIGRERNELPTEERLALVAETRDAMQAEIDLQNGYVDPRAKEKANG